MFWRPFTRTVRPVPKELSGLPDYKDKPEVPIRIPDITFEKGGNGIEVFFDGHLHLQVFYHSHDGINAWVMGKEGYKIELQRKINTSILLSYKHKEVWLKMLDIIQKNL